MKKMFQSWQASLKLASSDDVPNGNYKTVARMFNSGQPLGTYAMKLLGRYQPNLLSYAKARSKTAAKTQFRLIAENIRRSQNMITFMRVQMKLLNRLNSLIGSPNSPETRCNLIPLTVEIIKPSENKDE